MRSNSPCDNLPGSQITPPFAPPKGILTTAHFQVIQLASARTSSSVTVGENRMPPLPGTADDGMVHAVTDKHFEVAAIENHRNVNRDFLVGIF